MSKRKIAYLFLCSTLILYIAIFVYFIYVIIWNKTLTELEIKWFMTVAFTFCITLPLCAITEPNK